RRASGRASGILPCRTTLRVAGSSVRSAQERMPDARPDARRKVGRQGKEIRLTAWELALLQFLLEHAGEVVSRSRIVEAVWEHDFETFSNVVEVYIRYLRAKIDEPFPRKLIQTVRGVGYSLRDEP